MKNKDYEKEYKAALERARNLHKDAIDMDDSLHAKMAEIIFPELKESEDERIIKWCISHFRACINVIKDNDEYKEYLSNKVIAWLEKQVPVDAKVIAKEVKQGIALSPSRWYDVSLIPQEQYELLVEWDSEDATWHDVAFYHAYSKTFWKMGKPIKGVTRWCYIKDLLGKQGEKESVNEEKDYNSIDPPFSKPQGKSALEAIKEQPTDNANKVEPKFKEGQWVIYMGTIAKILDLQKHCYVGKDINDKDFVVSYCNEHLMRKWTIQDAKDGDVLVLNDEVFIYSCRKYIYDIAVAHCFVDSAGGFYLGGEFGYWEYGNSIHPATKEQCDLLIFKMKEAGYEWDVNKKKLKKIENN